MYNCITEIRSALWNKWYSLKTYVILYSKKVPSIVDVVDARTLKLRTFTVLFAKPSNGFHIYHEASISQEKSQHEQNKKNDLSTLKFENGLSWAATWLLIVLLFARIKQTLKTTKIRCTYVVQASLSV